MTSTTPTDACETATQPQPITSPAPTMPTTPTSPTAQPTTMRAAVAHRYGTGAEIDIAAVPVPTPGPKDVLVKVEASSLNALDWHYLTGTPLFMRLTTGLRRPKRTIHGVDVAGEVAAVGSLVEGFAPGDHVVGLGEGGGLAEWAIVPARQLVHRPEQVSANDAAATPIAGLTALQGLVSRAEIEPGDRVLVNGAAGGVGTFAVQLAAANGATVTAVCSTRNVEMVRALGADEVIDYTTTDFAEVTEPVDVLFDNVGNRTARDCRKVLKPRGRYVMVSGPKTGRVLGPMLKMARMSVAMLRGGRTFHLFVAKDDRDDLGALLDLIAAGEIRPQIQRVIGLDGVADALDELGTGHAKAKIVVRPAGVGVSS